MCNQLFSQEVQKEKTKTNFPKGGEKIQKNVEK